MPGEPLPNTRMKGTNKRMMVPFPTSSSSQNNVSTPTEKVS
jgi:hypothetical protein